MSSVKPHAEMIFRAYQQHSEPNVVKLASNDVVNLKTSINEKNDQEIYRITKQMWLFLGDSNENIDVQKLFEKGLVLSDEETLCCYYKYIHNDEPIFQRKYELFINDDEKDIDERMNKLIYAKELERTRLPRNRREAEVYHNNFIVTSILLNFDKEKTDTIINEYNNPDNWVESTTNANTNNNDVQTGMVREKFSNVVMKVIKQQSEKKTAISNAIAAQELRNRLKEYLEELREKDNKLNELQKQHDKLNASENAIRTQNQVLNGQITALQNREEALLKEFNSAKKKMGEEFVEQKSNTKRSFEALMEGKEKEINTLNEEITRLRDNVSQNENKLVEFEKVSHDLESLRVNILDKEQTATNFQSLNEKLQTENTTLRLKEQTLQFKLEQADRYGSIALAHHIHVHLFRLAKVSEDANSEYENKIKEHLEQLEQRSIAKIEEKEDERSRIINENKAAIAQLNSELDSLIKLKKSDIALSTASADQANIEEIQKSIDEAINKHKDEMETIKKEKREKIETIEREHARETTKLKTAYEQKLAQKTALLEEFQSKTAELTTQSEFEISEKQKKRTAEIEKITQDQLKLAAQLEETKRLNDIELQTLKTELDNKLKSESNSIDNELLIIKNNAGKEANAAKQAVEEHYKTQLQTGIYCKEVRDSINTYFNKYFDNINNNILNTSPGYSIKDIKKIEISIINILKSEDSNGILLLLSSIDIDSKLASRIFNKEEWNFITDFYTNFYVNVSAKLIDVEEKKIDIFFMDDTCKTYVETYKILKKFTQFEEFKQYDDNLNITKLTGQNTHIFFLKYIKFFNIFFESTDELERKNIYFMAFMHNAYSQILENLEKAQDVYNTYIKAKPENKDKIQRLCTELLNKQSKQLMLTYVKLNNKKPYYPKQPELQKYKNIMTNPRYKYKITNNNHALKLSYIPRRVEINTNNTNDYGPKHEYYYGNFTNIFDWNLNNDGIMKQIKEDIVKPLIDNKMIFIIGYGASGSGKTSALVYLRLGDNGEEGIFMKICNAVGEQLVEGNNEIKLEIEVKEFGYANKNKNKNGMNEITGTTYNKEGEKIEYCNFRNKEIKATYKDGSFELDSFHNPNGDTLDFKADFKADSKTKQEPDFEHTYRKEQFESKKYDSKRNNSKEDSKTSISTLGEALTHAVDVDRVVKPTPNNPNSSRSHCLVLAKITANDKEYRIALGDFAGVENEFNPNNMATLKRFANIKGLVSEDFETLRKDDKGYSEVIDEYYGGNLEKEMVLKTEMFAWQKQYKEHKDQRLPNVFTNDELISYLRKKYEIMFDVPIVRTAVEGYIQTLDSSDYLGDKRELKPGSKAFYNGKFVKIIKHLNTSNKYVIQYNSKQHEVNVTGVKVPPSIEESLETCFEPPKKFDAYSTYGINSEEVNTYISADQLLSGSHDVYIEMTLSYNSRFPYFRSDAECKTKISYSDIDNTDHIKLQGDVENLQDRSSGSLRVNQQNIMTKQSYEKIEDQRKKIQKFLGIGEKKITIRKQDAAYFFLATENNIKILDNSTRKIRNPTYEEIKQIVKDKDNYEQDPQRNPYYVPYNVPGSNDWIFIVNETEDDGNYNIEMAKYRESTRNKDEMIKEIKEIIKDTRESIINAQKICENRRKDGLYINASLEQLREDINLVMYHKRGAIPNYAPNIILDCFKQYNKQHTDVEKIEDIFPVNKPNKRILNENGLMEQVYNFFYENSNSHVGVTNLNTPEEYVKKFADNLVICMFCVFNVTREIRDEDPKANVVPSVHYTDVNMFANYERFDNDNLNNSLLTFRERIDHSLLDIETEDRNDKLQAYKTIEFDDIVGVKDLGNMIENDQFNKFLNTTNLEHKIKAIGIIKESCESMNDASYIGTLELMDKVSKLYTTNVICDASNLDSGAQPKDYNDRSDAKTLGSGDTDNPFPNRKLENMKPLKNMESLSVHQNKHTNNDEYSDDEYSDDFEDIKADSKQSLNNEQSKNSSKEESNISHEQQKILNLIIEHHISAKNAVRVPDHSFFRHIVNLDDESQQYIINHYNDFEEYNYPLDSIKHMISNDIIDYININPTNIENFHYNRHLVVALLIKGESWDKNILIDKTVLNKNVLLESLEKLSKQWVNYVDNWKTRFEDQAEIILFKNIDINEYRKITRETFIFRLVVLNIMMRYNSRINVIYNELNNIGDILSNTKRIYYKNKFYYDPKNGLDVVELIKNNTRTTPPPPITSRAQRK